MTPENANLELEPGFEWKKGYKPSEINPNSQDRGICLVTEFSLRLGIDPVVVIKRMASGDMEID